MQTREAQAATRSHWAGTVLLLGTMVVGALLAAPTQPTVEAAFQRGGSGNDILIGRDDDNAGNSFIQPSGVSAKQHMENTDMLEGSDGHDLLVGLRGSDLLDGGPGNDILVGGVEGFQAPNSDMLLGGEGDDLSIWAPGDGSEFFLGGPGRDAEVLGPLTITVTNGITQPVLFPASLAPGQLPRVRLDGLGFRCELHAVPSSEQLGFAFIVRFFTPANALAVTVRLEEVEQLFCPSSEAGKVQYADLTTPAPALQTIPLSQVAALNPTMAAVLGQRTSHTVYLPLLRRQ